MIEYNQKLLRGVQGGGFLEKSPPWPPEAAGCCTLFTVVGFCNVQISFQT